MRDLLFIAIVIAFFALAAGYVRVCAWLVGTPDTMVIDPSSDDVDLDAAQS